MKIAFKSGILLIFTWLSVYCVLELSGTNYDRMNCGTGMNGVGVCGNGADGFTTILYLGGALISAIIAACMIVPDHSEQEST